LNEAAHDALWRLSSISEASLTLLFAFALGFLSRARSELAMLAAPLLGVLYVAAASIAFSRFHLFLPVATPSFIVVPTAFVVAVFIRYRFARALIMRLAPAPAARRMLTQPTQHRSAAETHDATIVFFDLIGSTAIAEKIAPADFNTLLNTYYDKAVENIEAGRGEIAAFSGDGVTAIFTGSHQLQNHAVRACLSVLAAFAAMRKVNTENASRGLPPLHMRVGMNSGVVAEGEIGAQDRFNFRSSATS
jgi:adenylate cyclase